MAQSQFNSVPYKSTGMGGYSPTTPIMPSMSINDYLQTLQATPSLNLPALNPAGLAFAGGMDLAPTGVSATPTYNLDLSGLGGAGGNTFGNPTGLNLGASAGGIKPMALTDKINTGVGVFNSALGAISAYKAYKLGKENLNFQKESFNKNYEAMKGTTNAQLADRQRTRMYEQGDKAMSVADYMAQYGVK